MSFTSVLIANRGEIALRIYRACAEIGLRTVAVHSEADATLPHVRLADQALCIGPGPADRSYLNIDAIILAAHLTGAEAIHPGYGFLSENADFARRVEEEGLVFIGPASETIRLMGDKVSAKQAMTAAGIPCATGSEGSLSRDRVEARRLGDTLGFPLMVKAAAGGGGRGMRVVRSGEELDEAVSITREEARRGFGNDDVYLERFLERPRHVEIQVMADGHGNAVWAGERDCSLQRRHQKVIEEAPAPGMDRRQIAELGESCVRACIAIGYRGAGTFEFLYEDERFSFIEMNTRIQVEHTVTEMITGLDLVKEQIRVAMGERLSVSQSDLQMRGHAIECRINAEDPETMMPAPGLISAWAVPGGPGIRVDTHVSAGYEVPPFYDSLLAKVIAHAPTRQEALQRMRRALIEMNVRGVGTNIPLHLKLLAEPEFGTGGVDIHHLERSRQ